MKPASIFLEKRIGILGLGTTGVSLIRLLSRFTSHLFCWDDSKAVRESVRGQLTDPSEWNNLDCIFVSPGVPASGPFLHPVIKRAKQLGTPIFSDIDLLFLLYPESKFVGITGTDGKSTTTAMIGHILSHSGFDCIVGGNIGVPVADLGKADIYVLELSSFQLDILRSSKLSLSVVTNLAPDHLDRYGNVETYYKSKALIVNFTDLEGVVLTENSCIGICEAAEKRFSRRYQISNLSIFSSRSLEDLLLADLELPKTNSLIGSHNIANAIKAAQVCRILGCSQKDIYEAFLSFKSLPHRLEYLGNLGPISFYNDSKATNVQSALCGLSSMENIHWLAGGQNLQQPLEKLLQIAERVNRGYFFGQAKHALYDALSGSINCSIHEDLEGALKCAVQNALEGQVECNVLLSPACKSFDQFRNFQERGDAFAALVKKLNAQ